MRTVAILFPPLSLSHTHTHTQIRFQADAAPTRELRRYKSVADAFTSVIKNEGFFGGLYKVANTPSLTLSLSLSSLRSQYLHIQGSLSFL